MKVTITDDAIFVEGGPQPPAGTPAPDRDFVSAVLGMLWRIERVQHVLAVMEWEQQRRGVSADALATIRAGMH